MNNLLQTLIYNEQVFLTLADTTEIVKKGARLHGLSKASAYTFGRALSLMTFMSACLKEETGEISLSIKGETCGEIAVSGNRRLQVRGYILNTTAEGTGDAASERALLGDNASLTIIRDDGYSRPFVGVCTLPKNAVLDEGFEEYFRISEQLPTRLYTTVEFDSNGICSFAGVVAVQPLPFTDDKTLDCVMALDLDNILKKAKSKGTMYAVKSTFEIDSLVLAKRKALYRCNCSREYLTRVLVSLGETQMREIIKEDGAVRVHCHYCNTDYEFTDKDADEIFKKDEE